MAILAITIPSGGVVSGNITLTPKAAPTVVEGILAAGSAGVFGYAVSNAALVNGAAEKSGQTTDN